jgi:hypothetical protein
MEPERPAVELSHPPSWVLRFLNPAMRTLLRTPLAGPLRRSMMVLRFTGRTTGRGYAIPVTAHRSKDAQDEVPYVLTAAPWRVNFRGGRSVDVTVDGRTTRMRGELVENTVEVAQAYVRRIDELGIKKAERDIGIAVRDGRVPTVEEMAAAVERFRFAIVRLYPADAGKAEEAPEDQ